MADVRPFRGLRYAPGIVGDAGQVICPPYDVIDPAQQAALYARSPYNAVRLEFGAAEPGDDESTNVYTRSAEWLRSWQQSGALERAARPTFYLMEEAYEAGGMSRRRRCLLAAVRLEPFDGGAVLPHEFTRPGPKEDRLRLMQACAANFSPLMALYRDPGGVLGLLESQAGARPPDVAAQSEGIAYRLWALDDASTVRELQGLLAPLPLYMADGHHRYETSLVYRDMRRGGQTHSDAGYDYVLMGLIELSDPGLDLLGYHRVVCGAVDGGAGGHAEQDARAVRGGAGAGERRRACARGAAADARRRRQGSAELRVGGRCVGPPEHPCAAGGCRRRQASGRRGASPFDSATRGCCTRRC